MSDDFVDSTEAQTWTYPTAGTFRVTLTSST